MGFKRFTLAVRVRRNEYILTVAVVEFCPASLRFAPAPLEL
jgi:hypothetical protein